MELVLLEPSERSLASPITRGYRETDMMVAMYEPRADTRQTPNLLAPSSWTSQAPDL